MKKILLLTLAAITICVIGCDKKMVDDLLNPELSLTPAVITADAAAGKYNIAVTSNTAWVAAVDNASVNSWCRIESGATGMEKGTITVALEANAATAVRTATLSVSAGTLTQQVTVTQEAAAVTLSVDKESISATVEADTYIIGVTSNATWTAASNAGWCTLADNSGNGNGTVTVNITENSTASLRAATVTVSSGTLSQQVAIIQEAAPTTLSVDKESIPATAAVGTYTIAVTSNSTWTATSNAGWCTLADASGNGNGTVMVTAAVNTAETARTATVTITSGTLSKNVTVSQDGHTVTPPHAASTQTWRFGNQLWSDVIQIPECNRSNFSISYVDPECRSNTYNNITYYYYNWRFVHDSSNTLCGNYWHVPTKDDIEELISAGDAVEFAATIQLSGAVWLSGTIAYGEMGRLWLEDCDWNYDDLCVQAYAVVLEPSHQITPQLHVSVIGTQAGHPVRCVRRP